MREDLVQGLRDLADFIEENPEVPVGEYASVSLYEYVYDEYEEYDYETVTKTAMQQMKELARLLKPCKKDYAGSQFTLQKDFGEHVTLEFATNRANVCERKVVEKIEHPASIREAWTEEKVEWVCNDPLLK